MTVLLVVQQQSLTSNHGGVSERGSHEENMCHVDNHKQDSTDHQVYRSSHCPVPERESIAITDYSVVQSLLLR